MESKIPKVCGLEPNFGCCTAEGYGSPILECKEDTGRLFRIRIPSGAEQITEMPK